jgi:hypothetical protein
MDYSERIIREDVHAEARRRIVPSVRGRGGEIKELLYEICLYI